MTTMHLNLARDIADQIVRGDITVDHWNDMRDDIHMAFHKLDKSTATTQARRIADRTRAKAIWAFVGTVSKAGQHCGAFGLAP